MDIIFIKAILVFQSFQGKILLPYLISHSLYLFGNLHHFFKENVLGIKDTIMPQLCTLFLASPNVFLHLLAQNYLGLLYKTQYANKDTK